MTSPTTRSANSASSSSVLNAEAVDLLQALLRIDTSTPPGNETVAARHIESILSATGITSTLLESAPGRGSLVARLPGDGREAPLLLVAHLDVVPAEASRWDHP